MSNLLLREQTTTGQREKKESINSTNGMEVLQLLQFSFCSRRKSHCVQFGEKLQMHNFRIQNG